ncbi:MAG: ATP-dependent helicase [Cytophagales bacterium]|nr:ATP-dependent helicase [Cytophagales bacterium]
MKYTQEQQHIFEFVKNGTGHGIIDAVAGAGKTTTIMASAEHVQAHKKMLFCAFNKSIAGEIESKFHQIGMQRVTVKTIHALGWQILRNSSTTGQPPRLEEKKYDQLLKSEKIQKELTEFYRGIIKINKLDPDKTYEKYNEYGIKNLLWKVNARLLDINQKFRATLCEDSFEEFSELVVHFGIFNSLEAAKEAFAEELHYYYRCHQILLEAGNELSRSTMITDYTDMLYLPVAWKLSPVRKFDFVFIDECQDLSRAQLAISLKHANSDARILAVGDPRQSIYGFTGADIESFERVRDITKAQQLPLTICFRCPQDVISIARQIRDDIRGSKQVSGIVESITPEQVIEMARAGDLIVSRVKAPLLMLIFGFIDKNIKVQIHDDEAQDFIRELRNLFKPAERELPFKQMRDGFEELKQTVIKRWEFIINKNAERIVDPIERDVHIMSEIAYLHRRLEFLHKKSLKWASDCPTMENILRKIMGFISAKENSIILSSIHRAKGLEENRVFIIDYPKLPHSRPEIMDWEEIQEVNLKYVAVTRAKEELYLVDVEDTEERELERSLFDDLF